MQYTHFVLRHSNFRGPRSDFKYYRKHVRKKTKGGVTNTYFNDWKTKPPSNPWHVCLKSLHYVTMFLEPSHLLWHSLLWCGLRNLQQGRRKSYHLKTSSSKRTLIWSNLFMFIRPFLSVEPLDSQHIMLGTHTGSSSANGKPLFPAGASIVTRTPKRERTDILYFFYIFLLTGRTQARQLRLTWVEGI